MLYNYGPCTAPYHTWNTDSIISYSQLTLTIFTNPYSVLSFSRIIKQAMRAGGSNITPTHAEDLSLCGLFLMDVTKTIDQEFGVHHSTSHTTTDATNDIKKLAKHLVERSPSCPSPSTSKLKPKHKHKPKHKPEPTILQRSNHHWFGETLQHHLDSDHIE